MAAKSPTRRRSGNNRSRSGGACYGGRDGGYPSFKTDVSFENNLFLLFATFFDCKS